MIRFLTLFLYLFLFVRYVSCQEEATNYQESPIQIFGDDDEEDDVVIPDDES
ncbi:MAG: hypothetical protein KBD31_03765 [Proteobacteria bacterium]|nr:hypothetical protein [Pseudomonadota bacterium]